MATIESYDETDLDDIEFLIGTGERKLDHVAGALAVPSARRSSYLMMLSLLEYICGMHVPEKDKSQRLFKVLCEKLARFDDMTEFFSIDELTRIRSNYLDKFSHIMRKAVTKFLQDEPFISKKNLDILFTPPIDKRFMNNRSYEEAFCVTSSRYSNEFVQMKSLGKGAFGVVFKAKSCLDDQFYAVKRISLHKAHFESWKHLIQESKILAGLKHQNIVGYHTAWLENTQSTDLADRAFLYRGLPSAATKDMQESQSTSESSDGIYFSDSASKIKIITESVNKNKRADPINLDVDLQSEDSASDSKLIDCAQHITVQSHSEKDIDPLIGVEQSASFPICDISNKKKHLMVNFSQENDHGENFSLPSGHFNMDNVIMNEMSNSHDASIAVYNRQINRKNGIFRRSLSHDPENDHKHHHNEIVPLHHDSKFVLQGHWNLFIQMELCDETLRDWIFKRNQSAVQLCDIFECVDTKINNGIFTQILTGLQFIHSKGLIHRDVKPRNIFLCKNSHAHLLPTVKIGDFGLATMRSIIQSLSTPPSYPASYHTAGVGTEPYASPEQMDGKKYGPKTDIYSLGVILFELYHPFSCEMERAKLLKLLPIVSKQFSSRRTGIALMIEPLMAADPSERPSINDMQKSSVFTRSREKKSKFTGEKKKRNIKELQIHNQKLETENSDLKCKLEQKDVMIKMLQDRLTDIGYK